MLNAAFTLHYRLAIRPFLEKIMPFVVEKITQTEIDPYLHKILRPVYALQAIRIIDRDRDLVLLHLGGRGEYGEHRGEAPTYFNFFWKGATIAFECYISMTQEGDHWSKFFDVRRFRVPSRLEHAIPEVRTAIEEALTTYFIAGYKQPFQVSLQIAAVELY
ncbi:MAG: hypothetical protein ACJ8GW_11720 [Massilia sp.]